MTIERGMVRNRKFLDLCHFAPCFLSIEGVCQSGVNPFVPAHSNHQRHGRGMSHKSHDCYVVPACPPCHHELDAGKSLTRQQRDDLFMSAWERWMLYVFRYEMVEVKRAKRATEAA